MVLELVLIVEPASLESNLALGLLHFLYALLLIEEVNEFVLQAELQALQHALLRVLLPRISSAISLLSAGRGSLLISGAGLCGGGFRVHRCEHLYVEGVCCGIRQIESELFAEDGPIEPETSLLDPRRLLALRREELPLLLIRD